jgi:methionyl-tRNA synthetase
MIIADAIARYNRSNGSKVMLLTGTDEYGLKIEKTAHELGKTPYAMVEENSAKFKSLALAVNCSYDRFIRTTEGGHHKTVHHIWEKLNDNGHIYLGTYKGWYSIRDETFYTEGELVDGLAPTGADVHWVEEESYFFRLSAFTNRLLDHYEKCPGFVHPDGRMKELKSMLAAKGQLDDVSISRTSFSWGIKVPSSSPSSSTTASCKQHVVYVWLDALVNYLSALQCGVTAPPPASSLMEQFWPADMHVIGKDILRFHAVLWPAVLLAADLPLPRSILAHGWWTMDGQKMSKSIGNVVDPFALVDRYGADYLRYFLLAETPTGSDGDFSEEALHRRINSDLCDAFGNLVQRVLSMAHKHCEQRVPLPCLPLLPCDEELLREGEQLLDVCREQCLPAGDLHRLLGVVLGVARAGNRYADQQAPWKLRKTDPDRMRTSLYVLIELVRKISVALEPVVPASAQAVFQQVNVPENLRTLRSIAQRMEGGQSIDAPSPIFRKIVVDK